MTLDAAVSASMRCICEYAESGLRQMLLRVCEGCFGLAALARQRDFERGRFVRKRGTIDRARH